MCGVACPAAEALYQLALHDLNCSASTVVTSSTPYDAHAHSALANCLRDLADQLALDAARVAEAEPLIARALALNAFRGRRLDIGFALTTRARMALTTCHFEQSIQIAADAVSIFDQFKNWSGWIAALGILLDALAANREAGRMLALLDFAAQKLATSGLSQDRQAKLTRTLAVSRAEAYWTSGDLQSMSRELEQIERGSDAEFQASDPGRRAERLWIFAHPGRTPPKPAG